MCKAIFFNYPPKNVVSAACYLHLFTEPVHANDPGNRRHVHVPDV